MPSPSDEARANARVRLSVELQAALLRELKFAWHALNGSYFKDKLRSPTFALSDTVTRLGEWDPETRTISISSELVFERPWGTVVEVLKHEIAHQYVHEVAGASSETAHGPTFRQVCRKLGIDARAAGFTPSDTPDGEQPTAPPSSRVGDERILTRIAKLLALAESDSVNEAHAAMSAAQRLMLKYNLENVEVEEARRGYGYRHLGRATGRVSEAERMVAVVLAAHFFVEIIWVPVYRPLEGKRGSILEACGTPANLEMASYVYSFLLNAGEQLWREHKKAHSLSGNRDRRTYLAGVMAGFHAKLIAERETQQREGLVWTGDADLHGYYRRRHPHIQQARYAGSRRTEAHAHGREAGRKLVLHRPVSSGSEGGKPKLLGR